MLSDFTSLKDALFSLFGAGCSIESRTGVSGGDINVASLLRLSTGTTVFLKENRADLAPMFFAEASGLAAMAEVAASSESPPVPNPLAYGVDGKRSFLLMEEL